MDAKVREQIDEKIKELQIAHDEKLKEWNQARGELQRARRDVFAAQDGPRQRYIELAARAYELTENEIGTHYAYKRAHAELVSAHYIIFMDDDPDANPSEQAMAISRLLYGDD